MKKRDRVPDVSRREVLTYLPVIAVGAGLGGAGCSATLPSATVSAGPPDSIPEGAPRQLEGYDVYLIRGKDGVAAISGKCMHAGCGVDAAKEGFSCGCHGSQYAPDGTVTEGPAEADLRWLAVRVEGGQVMVDPTKEVAKGTYTPLE